MMYKLSLLRCGVVAAISGCAMLGGCFGGGDDDDDKPPAATSQVPGSASQSVGGFISYLQALVVSDANTLEPVDTSAVTAPKDNTAEPVAVN